MHNLPSNKVLRRSLSLLLPHRKQITWGLIALVAGSSINLFFPYLVKAALNQEYGFKLEAHLSFLALGLALLFAIQSLFFYFRHYFFQVVGYKVGTELKEKVFSALITQDISYFEEARTGDLISRLTTDTEVVQRNLTINISVVLRYLVQVIGGTALMLFISPELTGMIIIIIPLIVFSSMYWGKKLRALSRKFQAQLGEASVTAEEAVSAIRTIKLFAGDSHEISRYSNQLRYALSSGIERSKYAAFFSSTMVFLLHTAIAMIVWYGGNLVLRESLSIGDLTGFLLYGVVVAVSFGFLSNAWVELMQAAGAADRLFEIIDSKPKILSPSKPKSLPRNIEPDVVFDNVSFSYPTQLEREILSEVSFKITTGETIALVGPSGAGKSTIASLIPRFYDVSAGCIYYAGIPIEDLSISELRSDISFVPQAPQIFSLNIYENIRYGRLNATRDEIIEAAKAANLHNFIETLPNKYDTPCGDKGVKLSGGEKQRLAIARALLKNARFLILDEATSALDSENEFLVRQALERLMKGRTTLVIAHRLSTVRNANKVIVLKNGKIFEQGTHSELATAGGLYQTLVQYQLLN